MFRYTISYDLIGTFFECDVEEDRVRLYNIGNRTTLIESRTMFATRLMRARRDRYVSVVRYDMRTVWSR